MSVDVDTAEKQNTAMSQSCDTAGWKSITVLPHDSILDLALEGLEKFKLIWNKTIQQCQNGKEINGGDKDWKKGQERKEEVE